MSPFHIIFLSQQLGFFGDISKTSETSENTEEPPKWTQLRPNNLLSD